MADGDRGFEQPVWEATALVIDVGDPDLDRAALRVWVGEQMRSAPWRVWDSSTPPPILMRESFVTAIEHAAAAIVAGRTPD